MENIDLANLGELTPEEAITLIYIAYYDRAPDPVGHDFWENNVLGLPRTQEREGAAIDGVILPSEDGFWGLDDIGSQFSDQDETRANYPFFANLETATRTEVNSFINAVYQNLFGRAADQEGLDFHGGNLFGALQGQNDLKIGEIIVEIAKGAQNSAAGQDLTVVQNKIEVANAWLNAARSDSDLNYEQNSAAKTSAKDTVKSVTSAQSTVDDAKAAVTAFFAEQPPVGTTINLTTGTDLPGGAGNGTDTQGTAGADTYAAVGSFEPFFGSTTATLNSTDNIAAGGGIDAMNLRVVDLQGLSTTASPAATGLENFFVTVQDTTTVYTLDFAAIDGEAQVWGVNSGENAGFMANNVDMGTAAGLENYDGVYAINYKGDLSGTNDSFSAVFNGAGDDSTNPAFFATVDTSGNTVTSFEVVNIASTTAASKVQFDTMTLRDITVTGDAALELFEQSNFAGLASVDGSGNTGGTNVNALGASALNFMFMGGEAADRIVLSSSLLNTGTSLSLNGGAGKDTLATNTSNANLIASAVNAASGFEVLENVSSSASTLDAKAFTGIDEFLFSAARTSRTNITDAETDDRFVIAADLSSNSGEALSITGAAIGTDVTIEITHGEGSDGTSISTSDSNQSGAIRFRDNVDDVNLISTGATANANEILHTSNSSANDHYAFYNEANVNGFTLSGDTDLTIVAQEGVDLSQNSDQYGFRESVNFDASSFTGNLRIAGSQSADAIAGGSGNDIIYDVGGANQVTGNDGSDQFRFSDHFGSNNSDTITDFEVGTDKVGLNEINFGNTTATAVGTTLASADYIENVSSISNLSSAEDEKLIELQSSASSNQITSSTSSATVDAFLLIFNTDTNKAELWYDNNWSTTGGRSKVVTFDNVDSLVDTVGFSNTDFVEYSF